MSVSSVLKEKPALHLLFLGVTLVLAFLVGFFRIVNSDIWWHMKAGELILSNGLLTSDPFSFTAFGQRWVTHEWLAEVFFYLVHHLFGIVGLIAFKGIITAFIAFIIFRFGVRNGYSAALSAALTMFAVAGMSYMINARPHVFTFLFLAIECSFLFGSQDNARRQQWWRWVILPLIFVVWANMHGGFILGLAIYWVCVVKDIFFAGGKAEVLRQRLVPAAIATIACAINPNGLIIFYYPVMIAGSPLFKQSIAEWVSPVYLGRREWLALSILTVASLLGLASAIGHARRRPDISLVVAAVGISAWLAMRNIQNYVVVLSLALFALPLAPKLERSWSTPWARRLEAIVSALWVFALFVLIRDYQKDNGRLGIGIKEGFVPQGAVSFLKQVGFSGNLLNILSDGGYLIWSGYPQWRVFVDGRLDVYGEKLIEEYRRTVQGAPGALQRLDQLKIDAAVLPMPPNLGAIREQLMADNRWALVYFDDYYLVFLRHTPNNQEAIERWGYHVFNPLVAGYGLDQPEELAEYLAETERGLALNPRSSLANAAYGYGLSNVGRYQEAARAIATAIRLRPSLLDFYRFAGWLYLKAGFPDSAAIWYRKRIKYSPPDYWTYVDLGRLHYQLGQLDSARFHLENAVRLHPGGQADRLLEEVIAAKKSLDGN